MATQLNIKYKRTVELARAIAGRSGKTVTETIRDALEAKERADVTDREARRARMIPVADRGYDNFIHTDVTLAM